MTAPQCARCERPSKDQVRLDDGTVVDLCVLCLYDLCAHDSAPERPPTRYDYPPEGRMMNIPNGSGSVFTTLAIDHNRKPNKKRGAE